jgi:hypothetical protein
VVGCQKNPALRPGLTEDEFFAAGHVAVAIGNQRTMSFADRTVEAMGRTRRIEVTAPSFTMVPWLLLNTHRLPAALCHSPDAGNDAAPLLPQQGRGLDLVPPAAS